VVTRSFAEVREEIEKKLLQEEAQARRNGGSQVFVRKPLSKRSRRAKAKSVGRGGGIRLLRVNC